MFNRGPGTLPISAQLFAENRMRLVAALKGKVDAGSVVVLQGGVEKNRYNTDAMDLPFRQESYFFWTFGVHESGCFGAIDVDSGRSWLFPPTVHPSYAIWDGKINDETWFKQKYQVDVVNFHKKTENIEQLLKEWKPKQLLLLRTEKTNSTTGILEAAQFPGRDNFNLDMNTLYPVMAGLRSSKTDYELEVMRYACKIGCDAHLEVMKNIRPGHFEYQMESLFRHFCYYHGGCRHQAYTSIVASGENCAILHYGGAYAPNDKEIKDGDLCLFDMGPEYNCYGSDITATFPVNGKFTEKQKIIYNAVLDANRTVFQEAKPGTCYLTMHYLSQRVILTHLKAAGLIVGDLDEMMKAEIGKIFMPHGLGHLIGLDVHDVGTKSQPGKRSPLPQKQDWECTRFLQERMVITIEPGCYFIDQLLEQAYRDPVKTQFLVKEKIDEFKGFGGVRIEDCVIIWSNGNENITPLPRTVEEIEAFMARGGGHLPRVAGRLTGGIRGLFQWLLKWLQKLRSNIPSIKNIRQFIEKNQIAVIMAIILILLALPLLF